MRPHLSAVTACTAGLVAILTAVPVVARPVCGAEWAGHDAVTFYADLDEGPEAWKAAGNPWPVGRHFDVSDGAWANTARDGYVAWDATDNVPVEAGTVSLLVRSGEANIFTDGRPHCIASIPRTVAGMYADEARRPSTGLALSLRKTAEDTLVLIAHIGGDEWMRGAEPTPVISLDATKLPADTWHHLTFSWDWAERTLWLVVDGEAHSAPIPDALTEPWALTAACFGNTENYLPNAQEPLDGSLDEIAILDVAWPEAQDVMAADAPLTADRPEPPDFGTEATVFPDDERLARLEWLARNHLNLLVETQNVGGWDLTRIIHQYSVDECLRGRFPVS